MDEQHALPTACNGHSLLPQQQSKNTLVVRDTHHCASPVGLSPPIANSGEDPEIAADKNQRDIRTLSQASSNTAPSLAASSDINPPSIEHDGSESESSELSGQSATVSANGSTDTNARGHVKIACTNCRKRHLACDVQRPCSRCVSFGLQCVNGEHKKRGRPRMRGRPDETSAPMESRSAPYSKAFVRHTTFPPFIPSNGHAQRSPAHPVHHAHSAPVYNAVQSTQSLPAATSVNKSAATPLYNVSQALQAPAPPEVPISTSAISSPLSVAQTHQNAQPYSQEQTHPFPCHVNPEPVPIPLPQHNYPMQVDIDMSGVIIGCTEDFAALLQVEQRELVHRSLYALLRPAQLASLSRSVEFVCSELLHDFTTPAKSMPVPTVVRRSSQEVSTSLDILLSDTYRPFKATLSAFKLVLPSGCESVNVNCKLHATPMPITTSTAPFSVGMEYTTFSNDSSRHFPVHSNPRSLNSHFVASGSPHFVESNAGEIPPSSTLFYQHPTGHKLPPLDTSSHMRVR